MNKYEILEMLESVRDMLYNIYTAADCGAVELGTHETELTKSINKVNSVIEHLERYGE